MKKPAPRGQFSTVSLPTPGGMGYSRRPPPKTGGVPTKTGPKTRKNDRFFEFSPPPPTPRKTPVFRKNRVFQGKQPRTAQTGPKQGFSKENRPKPGGPPAYAPETRKIEKTGGFRRKLSSTHLRAGGIRPTSLYPDPLDDRIIKQI